MSSQADIELVLAARLTEFLDGLSKAQDSLRRAVLGMSGTAKKGANDIDQSFRTLGIRPLKDIQREIREVQQAYRKLASSGKLSAEEQARAAQAVQRRIAELQNSARGLGDAWVRARGAILGASLAVGTSLLALGNAAKASNEFGLAIAEVNSLLPEASQEIGSIESNARALAREFGNSPTAQAHAFYQAISAGAADAGEATDILNASNRLALGGVTDITTATDGLTSVLNAYQLGTDQATQVSDLFFTAVRDGKTTVEELANGIGSVAPVAASTNVSLGDLLAAVSAITKGGVATSEAMTQVRSILSAVIKPTAEAQSLAKDLGIQFDVAALKSKGFSGFIEELIQATGGSETALSRLLGRTEALQGALTLGVTQVDSFNQILADMENAAGATEQAVAKLVDSDAFRSRRFQAALQDLQISLGQAVTAASPVLELLGDLINRFNELPDSIRSTIGIVTALVVTLGSLGLAANAVSGPLRLLFTHFKALDAVPRILTGLSGGLTSTESDTRLLSGAIRGIPLLLLVQQIGAAALEWNHYRDAQRGATQAQFEASEAARDLQERIESIKRTHAGFAEVTIKTGEEIRQLTEGEFIEYQAAIEKAQTLWRALVVEARRAGDSEGLAQAQLKLEEYKKALQSAGQTFQELLEENQRAASRLGSLVEQLSAVSSETDKLGAAIKTALASADDRGLRNVALALGQLASRGSADAKQVQEALANALGELDPARWERFAAQSDIAFRLINRGSEATEAVLKTTLNSALQSLGVETENLSAQSVASFRTIAESSLSSSQQIEMAFVAALTRATRTDDVERLQAALTLAGQRGAVGMEAVASGANRALERMRQLQASTHPLSNDFAQLGIRSRQELEGLADTAQASYQRIRAAAADGQAAQEDVRAAFLAWGKAALEAAERADPATRRVIAGQIELEGAVVGVKNALSQLGGSAEDSAGKAANAAQAAASSVQAAGEEAVQETAKLKNQLEITQTTGGALAQVISGAFDAVRELSSGASAEVDKLIVRLNARIHGDPSTFISRLGDELGKIRSEFERQTALADQVIENYERVGHATVGITDAIHLTTGELKLLDQQRLDRLQSILATTRREAEALTNSVREGTQALRQELARVRGDEEEVRRLDFQRRREKIQLQIQEARGNAAAQQELQEQLRLLNQIEKAGRSKRNSESDTGGAHRRNRDSDSNNDQEVPRNNLSSGSLPTSSTQTPEDARHNSFSGAGQLPHGNSVIVQFRSADGLGISGRFGSGDVNRLFEILRRSGATTSGF